MNKHIYHCSHKSRKSEASFVKTFRTQFPDAEWHNNNYPIAESYFDMPVCKDLLLSALKNDKLLSRNQRNTCIEELENCPELLKVISNHKISFDIVVTEGESVYYFEYHENQHRQLKDNREKFLYNAENNNQITVPRCLQRLVRDVWRLQNFRPYTIVWKDWFEKNTYKPQLQSELHEYGITDKFSFKDFISNISGN